MADNTNNGLPPGATLVSGTVPQQASSGGLPPGATLVSGTVPGADSAAAPAKPGMLSEIGSGIKEAGSDIWGVAKGMVPGGPAETNALKTIWNNLPPVELADSVKQTLPLIDTYEKERAKGSSIGDSLKAVDATARQHAKNVSALPAVVDAFRANPTRETARAVTDATALVAATFAGGALGSPEDAAATAAAKAPAAAESPSLVRRFLTNPFRRAVATPVAAGEAAAQPIAQAGVVDAAPTVGASLRSGIDVQTPFAEAKGLYRTVDDAAKTDFKSLYDKLDVAQDKAREAAIGSPEEAKAQLDIKNTQDAIDDAKKVAKASGVPDVDKTLAQADAKFAETQANKDFNSKFFGRVVKGNVAHGVPESIDVDKAVQTLEDMDKANKYGPSRLQQTSLGKDGAFKLKQYMYDAQKAGQKAVDARALRNTMLKWGIPGVSAVLGAAYELTK